MFGGKVNRKKYLEIRQRLSDEADQWSVASESWLTSAKLAKFEAEKIQFGAESIACSSKAAGILIAIAEFDKDFY